MSNKTNSEDRYITEEFVTDVLNGVHTAAEDPELMENLGIEGLDYVLGGGMAVQSYVMEGYADRVREGDLNPNEISVNDVLRGTEDIDLGFYSESVSSDAEIFMDRITNASKAGFNGVMRKRGEKSFTGKVKEGDGRGKSMILNAAGELKGAPDEVYRQMFKNRDKYSQGDTVFFRLGVEELIASKLDGFVNNNGRQKDAEDVKNLLYFQEGNIDQNYLQNRIAQYETGEDMAKVLEALDEKSGIHTYQ